jgi:hypothetical protein
VKSGFLPLDDDFSATTPDLAVTVDAGAAARFFTRQQLRGLNVNGTVSFDPAGNYAILTRALSVGPSGRLNLFDKDLIIDPWSAGDPPVSAAAIQALLAGARNGGTWDGFGITTGMADALSGLTGIGVAPAPAVLQFPGKLPRAVFDGHTITPAAVLLKYTYVGDANLDGVISGDDYSAIDFNIALGGASGWWNGDFNLDGIISGDDYTAIDFNIVAQGAPL